MSYETDMKYLLQRLDSLESRLRFQERLEMPATSWAAYTPTWTSTSNPSIGNGTLSGRYIQIGHFIHGEIYMLAGSSTTFGSGIWHFSFPVTPTNVEYIVGHANVYDVGATRYIGQCIYGGATYLSCWVNGNWVSSSGPMAWATGDILRLSVTYEV